MIICQVMVNLSLALCIYIFRRHGATLAFIWLDTIHFCPPNKCKSVHQKNIFPQENIWLISCYMLTRCLVRFIKSFLLKNANWKRSWWDPWEEREPYPVSRINVGSVRFSSTYWLHVSLSWDSTWWKSWPLRPLDRALQVSSEGTPAGGICLA